MLTRPSLLSATAKYDEALVSKRELEKLVERRQIIACIGGVCSIPLSIPLWICVKSCSKENIGEPSPPNDHWDLCLCMCCFPCYSCAYSEPEYYLLPPERQEMRAVKKVTDSIQLIWMLDQLIKRHPLGDKNVVKMILSHLPSRTTQTLPSTPPRPSSTCCHYNSIGNEDTMSWIPY